MKDTIKRYITFIVGLLFFGVGIAFGYKSLLGSDPMGVFVGGLANVIKLEVWLANIVVGLVEIAIGFVLERKNVTLATLIGLTCGSFAINLGMTIIPDSNVLFIRIIYMCLAVLSYTFGIAVQQYANCGLSNLDCLIFGLKRLFRVNEYYRIRWAVDAFFLIGGFLLGGVINVGSALFIFFSGILIQFFKKQLDKTGIL